MFMSSAKLSSNSDKLTFRNKTFENSRSAILANFGWTLLHAGQSSRKYLTTTRGDLRSSICSMSLLFSSSSTPSSMEFEWLSMSR